MHIEKTKRNTRLLHTPRLEIDFSKKVYKKTRGLTNSSSILEESQISDT